MGVVLARYEEVSGTIVKLLGDILSSIVMRFIALFSVYDMISRVLLRAQSLARTVKRHFQVVFFAAIQIIDIL